MIFTQPSFALFFTILFGLYWAARSNAVRKDILLAASYIFYGAWDWRFAGMLLGLSAADYWFARGISHSQDPRTGKLLVMASLAMNLSVLAVFKYLNFFLESAVETARLLHVTLDQPTLHIILPVGVSFFTFQSLSYTIDVYRREIPPAKNLRDYLLFAAFFPQLVAGPIVRSRYFLPQLDKKRRVSPSDFRLAVLLFVVGFAKKTCIADNISPYVDQVFSHPAGYSTLASITAVWLYAVQIFCDFSGYSDMAIAIAAMLGYRLTLNFDAPYLATSIREFWRRWHISLSSWIRDYIYISMGGRSDKRLLTYRNLVATMLAGGLWHGAAWTFVAWGGAHGAGQVVHQEFGRVRGEGAPSWAHSLIGWFITINFVCLCWVLFRAASFGDASLMMQRYLFLAPGGPRRLAGWLLVLPLGLLLGQFLLRRYFLFERFARTRLEVYALGMGIACAVILALLPFGHKPFIYFQF